MPQQYNPFDPLDPRRKKTGYYQPPQALTTTTDTGIPNDPGDAGAPGAFHDWLNGTMSDAPDSGIPDIYEEGGYTGGQLPPPPGTGTAATPSSSQYALPGWNQGKWEDTGHTSIKYQAGRIFSQFDPNAIRQNPLPLLNALRAAGINATMVGDDKIDFGDGYGPIDVITRDGQWAWMPVNEAGGGAGAGVNPATAPFMGGAGAGATGAPAGNSAFDAAIKAMVLKLMGQQPTDITTDPVYQQATNAYSGQQQRAAERERNAIAERMAASGQANSGAMDSRLLGAEQQRGENEASFAGELAVREMERQRDEIMQALQIGASMMTEEDRLALTEKLGLINAELQRQSITNQNTQAQQNLGWDMAQWQANQNWMPYLLGLK